MQTSRDLKLEMERIEPQTTAASKRLALVIGVSTYRNVPPRSQLRYAHRDAEDFARFLRSPRSGALGTTQIRLLTEQHATIAALRSALHEWLPTVAGPRDIVYLFFAGHGIIGERNEAYFIAHDSDPQNLHATGLSFREINETLSKRLKAQVVVLMADACHSGSIGWAGAADAPTATASALEGLTVADRNLIKILASRSSEQSFEDARWGGGHGVFTYSLLRGLDGEADRERDGYIRISELIDFISKEVPEQTGAKQNPRVAGNFEPRMALALTKPSTPPPRSVAALTVKGIPGSSVYVNDSFRGTIRPAGELTVDGLAVGAVRLSVDLPTGESIEQQLALGANTSIDIAQLPGMALSRLQRMISAGQLLGQGEAWDFFRAQNWDPQYMPAAKAAISTALEDLGQACVNDYVQSDTVALKRPLLLRAVSGYQALQVLRPDDRTIPAKIYFCQARAQIAGGEFAEAEKNLRASIGIDADFACAYNALGVALARLGRPVEARAAFDKAAELTPQWGLPYFQIGQALLNASRPDQAVPFLEKAVLLYPKALLPQWTLLRAYRLAGRGSAFEGAARALLAADPNYAPAYLEIGNFYESQRDYARAAQAFDLYLLLAPNFGDSAQVRERSQRNRSQINRKPPSLIRK